MPIKRGEIYWVDFGNTVSAVGSEQAGERPAVIIQNDVGNESSPVTIIAPITSKMYSKIFPTNVVVHSGVGGLSMDGTILLNQIRTIDKTRIKERIGKLPDQIMKKVDDAIKTSLGLDV